MFNEINEFYPTPPHLITKMLADIDFRMIESVLEPSAGRGDIATEVAKRLAAAHWRKREEDQGSIDCIELEPDLRHVLLGRKFRVVHDDFLTYRTHKRYDLIVMNPPFSNGDAHLLHAIELMQNGGTIVCILNAETLRNRHTKSRITLWEQLNKYETSIKYLKHEFICAERKTDVEIALVKVIIPAPEKISFIFEDLQSKEYEEIDEQCKDLVGGDFFSRIVKQYEIEVSAGIKLITEYKAMLPRMAHSFEDEAPTIELSIRNEGRFSSSSLSINRYVEKVRMKYWNELFRNKQFTGMLTSNLQEELFNKVTTLKDYDFSLYNIMQLQQEIMRLMSRGVEETILALFDKLSEQHSWYPECKKNIHYYSGWKTNQAHKINHKVIIPIHGAFSSYSWSTEAFETSTVYKVMKDLEKTLSYLEVGDTVINDDLLERLKICAQNGTTKKIPLRYFNISLYKKGTCHIEFTDLDLLERLNIFGSQRKNWLPPCYGKRAYSDMTEEEQTVIRNFQSEEEYNRVFATPEKYIIEPQKVLLLGPQVA